MVTERIKIIIVCVFLCSLFGTQSSAELSLVIEGDPWRAYKTTKKNAENGDLESQYRLGRMYSQGLVVQHNPKLSFRWINKAAQRDHVEALYFLGQMYLSGTAHVQKDHDKGISYMRRAAGLGLLQAKKKLALMYLYPELQAHKDTAEGMKWLIDAAESGDALMQVMLGIMYINGEYAEQDGNKGIQWINRAAEQGDEDALYRLGVFYYTGKHVPLDWVRSRCLLGLSVLYATKSSMSTRDREKKEKKLQLIDFLATRMNDRQKEASRQMAIEWLQTHSAAGVDASRIEGIL